MTYDIFWTWIGSGLVLAAVLVGCQSSPSSDRAASPAADDVTSEVMAAVPDEAPTYRQAPSFERRTLAGDTVRLSDWRGRAVVLNFWATWCGPCRKEIPGLIELQRVMGPERVRVVGVAIDERGADEVRPYARQIGINYPVIVDSTMALARKYGGHYAVPTTFIIDPEGRIRQRYMRIVTPGEMRAVLHELLAAR